jgi:Lrp/AsnC family leucine-responsive transcriptional regulator
MRKRKATPVGDLDSFDLAILDILQRDNTVSQRTIGEAVNLSAAAVQRRIKRMQEAGVIEANIAVVDPARLGRPITLIVSVVVESERADLIEGLKKSLKAAPEVQQCYYVTGETDFVVILTVRSMSEYEAFTRRLFLKNRNVKRFQTLVVMGRVKAGLSVPTD